MQRIKSVLFAATTMISVVACGGENAVEARGQLQPQFSSSQPQVTGGLTLSIRPKKTLFGGNSYGFQGLPLVDTVTVTVSGASGPFLYRWTTRKCNTTAGCEPSPRDAGIKQFVVFRIDSTHIKTDFIVQVKRNPQDSSAVARITLEGPREPSPGTIGVGFQCSAQAGVGWTHPFDRNPNTPSGSCPAVATGSCYRRNACTGVRECYQGGTACQR
ncbi:MAG TPA: hypothetical protein VNO19_02780 [Gemmatimonadales bacterium]|nr:hypothetical protein [Gemmatimonadales bacterium]